MILMHYFNRSYFEEETFQWPVLFWTFRVEVLLISVNILHTAFFLWINLKAKQFHTNWTKIMSILYIQHIIADVAWIGQKILLTLKDPADPLISTPFIVTSYIRVCCVYMGLSILPMLVTERYFATVLSVDYEKKSRGFIFWILLGLLMSFGATGAYTFHQYESSLLNFVFFSSINSLGLLGNIALLHINKKAHRQCKQSSLNARFQIAENIKVCRLVNCIVLSMGAFNVTICLTTVLDNFNLSIYARSLSLFAFDVSALIYSTIFPYICMHYCKQWKQVFMKVLAKIYRRRRSVAPYTANEEKRSSVILHNTFGQVMTDSSTESYFKQLEDSWNA